MPEFTMVTLLQANSILLQANSILLQANSIILYYCSAKRHNDILKICFVCFYFTGQRSFEMNITVPLFMYDSEWGIMGLLYGE